MRLDLTVRNLKKYKKPLFLNTNDANLFIQHPPLALSSVIREANLKRAA